METQILVYGRPVSTFFGLPDNNEKSLTYALGFTIAKSTKFRTKLFEWGGIRKISKGKKVTVQIEQQGKDKLRPDIKIIIDNKTRLIIEGKRYHSKPTYKQCKKYTENLLKNRSNGKQGLLIIYDDWIEKEAMVGHLDKMIKKRLPKSNANLICDPRTWTEVKELCKDCGEDHVLRDLELFLESERYKHSSLTSLCEDKKLTKPQVTELKDVLAKLRKTVDSKWDKSALDFIPGLYQDADFVSKDGSWYYASYRRDSKPIFGLTFKRRGKIYEAYVYFILAISELQGKSKDYYDDLYSKKRASYNGEYDELLFRISDKQRERNKQFHDLNTLGYFDISYASAK